MTTSMPFSGTAPLLLFVAKATLLLIAALVATIPLRRATAGARHLVWLAAVVGVLSLPLLSRFDSLRLGVLPRALAFDVDRGNAVVRAVMAQTARSSDDAVARLAPMPSPRRAESPALAPTFAPRSPTSDATPISLLSTLALIWSVVALAFVGWLIAGTISVRRIVAEARELTSPDWTMPLCEVADRLDLESPPRLVISDRTEMAFACRALSPTIVLPAAAEAWTDDRRRAVLFHELAHIKRHDLVGHALGRLACALYWFHPLIWTAARNLRAESERACDDLVLSCGARPSEYAQHLLEMVTSVRNYGAPLMALPMARKKEFEGRMLAILDPAIRRASPGRLQSAVVVATVAVLSLTVAAVAPASPNPESASDVAVIAQGQIPQPAPLPAPVIVPRAEQPERPQDLQPPQGPQWRQGPQPSQGPQALQGDQPNNASPFMPTPWATQQSFATGAQAGDTARAAMLVRVLLTDSDAHVRRTAAWGLNELRTTEGRDALIRALRSDVDWQVRETAAWALAEYRGDVVASALVQGLRDKSVEVRSISAWGIANIGSKKNVGDLESVLSDSNDEVREMAIWAIGELGVKSAPITVVNALTDNSQQIRVVAAWALGEIADASTVNAIAKAFQTETSSEVKKAELRALAEIGTMPQAVLDAALKSSDPELRRQAVAALAGGSGDNSWPWPRPNPRPNP